MKKLKTLLQYRYTFKIITILAIFLGILNLILIPKQSKYTDEIQTITGNIIDYYIDGDKLTITLIAQEKVLVNYILSTEEEQKKYQDSLTLGDKLTIKGSMVRPDNSTVPNTFNYRKYLENKQIYYLMTADKIEIIAKNTSIFYELKSKILQRMDKIDNTGYLRLLLLGNKQQVEKDILSLYQENGISHLFAVSGLHVSLLMSIVFFVLRKITYHLKLQYVISSLFLLFYLFLVGGTASILRTTTVFLLSSLNTCLNYKIKKIDIILLSFAILFIFNPLIIFDIGFQFSYIITFFLTIFHQKISSISSQRKKSLYLSWLCFLVSFPLTIYYYYQVNFLTIFLNLFFIPLISVFLFPLCFTILIFPILEPILQLSVSFLETSSQILSNITFLQVIFAKPNILIMILYYLLIYLSLRETKFLKCLIMIIILHKNIAYFNSNMEMLLIDVSQGDCILIRLPYNQGNILIDTGGITTYEKETWQERKSQFSLAKTRIIPYLKSIGVSELDFLILTHGDYDHMGEAQNLINNFKINSVIFNQGEYNTLEEQLINVLSENNIPYTNSLKQIKLADTNFYFLKDKIYDNENENSNIIYFQYQNYHFLLMGDATSNNETSILKKYNIPEIDFLKVGHHGSNTSSSLSFIEKVNPTISLISVGKNNYYGHPSKEVLENLESSMIYRTDLMGSVLIKINNTFQITTYPSEP